MRAHHLQHASFEGLGSIKAWLQNAGYEISITKVCESMKLPSPNEIDLLVLTGGPMSVNDEFSWLSLEKEFVRRVIEFSKPVLGICLGAQLMANAMGGEVFPNPVKEIGWFPVQSVATKPDTTFVFPESTRVFHWHSETFSLPPGAIRIAESAGCQNQAFQMGKSVIGLQFHLETTSESAQELVSNCKDELVPSRYVQCEEDILSNRLENYAAINQLMANLLSYLMLS